MEIVVTINGCKDCRHRSHSGAFTPGGAVLTCDHPKAVTHFGASVPAIKQPHHWKHRVVELETIPEKCPLKAGERY